MKRIRPLEVADIPEVAGLYERVGRYGSSTPTIELIDYFQRTFLGHPWVDDEIPSLVYVRPNGKLAGFIGSHVRRLRMGDRELRMACSGQLVTAPEARGEAAGVFLVAEFLRGLQDLSITDGANEEARQILERLGAETLHLSSIDWIRVFRPTSVAAEFAWRRSDGDVPGAIGRALRLIDGVVASVPRTGLRPVAVPTTAEDLTPDALCRTLAAMSGAFEIRPDYDRVFLDWLFRELSEVTSRGTLVRKLVRAPDGRALGWYVSYMRPGGLSDVVQVVAVEKDVGAVLDHLFWEADRCGVSGLRGRVEPRLLRALWGRQCALRHGVGAIAYSREPEIMASLRSGRALLTRMDGEWWMGHHTEAFGTSPRPRGVRRAEAGIHVEIVDDLDSLHDDWVRLAAASGNVFATWEWNRTWWNQYGDGRRLAVGVCRTDATVVGIVPLYYWKERPIRVLRFLGHGHGDALGPVCQRADPMASDMLETVLGALRFDIVLGDLMLGGEALATSLRGTVVSRTGYPILPTNGRSWDDYVVTRTASLRKDFRRLPRKLARDHRVEFRLADDPARLSRDLDVVFALHRARFDRHEDCLYCGSGERFQRAFAARALAEGWLRLWILEVDGRPVAADHGFRFGNIEFGYQAGRDPSWNHASVGFVLQEHVLRYAFAEGVDEYRFLEGSESYKYRFTDVDPGLETIVIAGTRVGTIALKSAMVTRGLPSGARLSRLRGAALAAR